MNEIKREIGQVWKHNTESHQVELLKGYTNHNDQHRFITMCTWDAGTIEAGSRSDEYLHEDYTLITNADGTPYQEPKQYREIDVWEAMRLLGEAREPIAVQVKDSGEWYDEILTGALRNADFQFKDPYGNGWKQCRIEVKS